jgi:large conductance mechanosensitive channel
MGIFKEFREFIQRGNVTDLAIGIIIGGAFQKIVSSLVADVIMPPLGILISGINFTSIKIPLKDAVTDASGKVVKEAVTINIGNFLQATMDFLIIAFVIFMLVKMLNSMRKKSEAKEAAETPPAAPTTEEKLLAEIRDLLKEKGKA